MVSSVSSHFSKITWGYDNSRKTSSQWLKAVIEQTKCYELQLESIGNITEISMQVEWAYREKVREEQQGQLEAQESCHTIPNPLGWESSLYNQDSLGINMIQAHRRRGKRKNSIDK